MAVKTGVCTQELGLDLNAFGLEILIPGAHLHAGFCIKVL